MSGVRKRVVSQKGGFAKGWFRKRVVLAGCSPVPKTGSRVHLDVPRHEKTGTRVHSDVSQHQKPERGHIRQNRPLTNLPFCFLSRVGCGSSKGGGRKTFSLLRKFPLFSVSKGGNRDFLPGYPGPLEVFNKLVQKNAHFLDSFLATEGFFLSEVSKRGWRKGGCRHKMSQIHFLTTTGRSGSQTSLG